MSWVAVGISVVGGVSSIMGGKSAQDAAEKAGEEQAKIILATAEENQRRRGLDLQNKLGGITAAVGASNLQMGGSSERYKNVYESNIRAEMGWDRQKARMDAEAAKNTGQAQGQAAMYQGYQGALQSAGTAVSAGYAHGQANQTVGSSSPFYFGKKSGVG
jgi:hypothetical protein